MKIIKNHLYLILSCGIFFINIVQILSGQVHDERGSVGIQSGLTTYFGTFTSSKNSFNVSVFGRYNFTNNFAIQSTLGLTGLRYILDNNLIANDKNYFGDENDIYYPNTFIPREYEKKTDVFSLDAIASYTFLTDYKFAPYGFVGFGAIYFSPKNLLSKNKLPNNDKNNYSKLNFIFPVGVGSEYYLTEDVTLNVKASFNISTTNYLDDYKIPNKLPDAFANFSIGGSYYLFGIIDCDKDLIPDSEEKELGTNPCNSDTDADSLSDYDEITKYFTDPKLRDTDGDDVSDYEEIFIFQIDPRKKDTDRDGLTDREELNLKTDPRKADTDGDKLKDGDEVKKYFTDPLKIDTDEDGLNDGEEVLTYKSDPTQTDTDLDGLNDFEEVNQFQTDPTNRDSDNDGLSDYDEIIKYKTLPTSTDSDLDGLTDGYEIKNSKTDPRKSDTDQDGVIDGKDKCPLLSGDEKNNGCPEPKLAGDILEVAGISFQKNSSKLDLKDKETLLSLTQLVQYINQCSQMSILIQGHCDDISDSKKNRELSEQRAESVKKWLIDQNIDPIKIEATVGYGNRESKATKMDTTIVKGLKPLLKNRDKIAIRIIEPCK